jgi:hypothetical protein
VAILREYWFAMSDVTHILNAMDLGDTQAAGQLLPLVYDELRHLAAAHLAREKPGQTLDATALVHEVYLRLAIALGMSLRSANRLWAYAKAWLLRELRAD